MNHTIEITSSVYKRLEKHVVGFDTPSNVIERLLDSFEGKGSYVISPSQAPRKRLYTNGQIQKLISEVATNFTTVQLQQYCDKQFSNEQLGLSFPLFISIPMGASNAAKREAVRTQDGVPRWTWSYEIQKDGRSYAICTQWYPRHDLRVKSWLLANK